MRIEIGHGNYKTVVEGNDKTLPEFELRIQQNRGFMDSESQMFIPYHAITYLRIQEESK